jgi:hypothetical protein
VTVTMTAAERLALQDRLMHYAWSMDRGDAAGVADCFTPDGVITNAAGERFEGREGVLRFATTAMRGREFRGRQHQIWPMVLQQSSPGCRAASYYQVVNSQVGRPPFVASLGWYDDEMVRGPSGWLIRSKTLRRWNSELSPRAGVLGQAPRVRIVGQGALPGQLRPADRLAMEDLMMGYATSLDRADVTAMQVLFAKEGVLQTGSLGEVRGPEGIRAFVQNAARQPNFAGRQHRLFPIRFEAQGNLWRALSYWKVETWTAGKTAEVLGLGYYDDLFGKVGGQWRFFRKAIHRWNSETAPMSAAWPPR